MIDVKETLNKAGERMEMAAMYLAEELSHIRAGSHPRWCESEQLWQYGAS